MAERISGLSIDLSMNTAELSRSFTSIKDSFRDIKRSAQVNLNNIKFDDKSVDTYKKNVNELSKSFDNQKKNVDDLRKHYDKMAATHGETSKEAMSARIEYNKQADELNKLGHAVENARTELHKLNVENSGFTKIGNAAETAGSGIQTFGGHVKDVGGGLTKWITAPVLGAITAAGGLTAAFGWNRLVGLDSAKAQLEGLGFSTKEVGEITDEVSAAIQGGMMTMAEGTSTAAGAMAAGVEQGDELARYLKLVDAAAVGANRPVNEMAQIFNRVQGNGKLMTEELNRVEDGMPGFSIAMAEASGVTLEEFKKMVTDGEIQTDQFLNVMEDFAGGMADAQADSWQGMVSNTKANIGILGESMLSGVFEQSKESIREFLDLLRSDTFKTWAAEAGETIGTVFTSIVDKVRTGVQWFTSLSDEQKKMIGIFSAVAVAAGPLLMAFGSIAIFVGGVVKAIAPLFLGLGKVSTAIKTAGGLAKWLAPLITKLAGFTKILAGAFAFLTGPVGLTVAAIAALGAGFVIAYKKSETFRNFIDGLKERFSSAMEWIGNFKDGIIGLFKGEGTEGVDILTSIGLSEGLVEKLFNISGYFLEFYHRVKGIIENVITTISGIFEIFKGNHISAAEMLSSVGLSEETIDSIFLAVGKIKYFFIDMGAGIKSALSTVGDFFEGVFTSISDWWNANGTIMLGNITGAFDAAKEILGNVFNSIKDAFSIAFTAIKEWWDSNGESIIGGIVTAFEWMKETLGLVFDLIVSTIKFAFKVVQGVFETFAPIVTGIWNLLWDTIKGTVELLVPVIIGLWDVLWNTIKGTIEILAPIISGIVKTAIDIIVNAFNYFAPIVMGIWNTLWPAIQFQLQNVWETIKSVVRIGMDYVQTVIKTVTAIINGDWSTAWETIKGFTSRTFETIKALFVGMTNRAKELISGMVASIKQWFSDMWSNVTSKVTQIKNDVVNRFNELKNNTIQKIRETYNSITKWFSDLWTTVKNTVTNMKNNVVNLFVNMKDGAIDGVKKLYTGTKNLFDDVKQYAKDTFTNMVDGAKELPGKLGSAIKNGASKAVDGVKSLGNKMTSKLGDVVNGVIGGINSVTTKIGITDNISEWTVPTFSTGTGQGSPSGKLTKNGKIAMDTMATVGDKGKGNGKGTRELVRYPNGKVGLYDNDATIFAPKGTTIFNNKETEAMLGQIPKFSEGTGLWGSIKQLAGKAIDYITNPKKIFDDLIALVGDSFGDMTGFAGNFIKGAWSMIKDGMFGWIKNKFSEASVGKSQKWMNYPTTTPYSPNAPVPGYPTAFNKGHHYGIDKGTPVGVNITSPMAGTVSRMSDRGGGNVARLDVAGNAAQYFMHMNSVKTGKVGIGDSVGKSGNTGEWTTGPHVHWQHEDPSASYVQNKNTKNPLSMIKGHLKGGQILSDGLFNLHKGEYVINPNEPTEAMKLLAIVGKKLAGKSKQTREIASVPGTTGNDELLDKMQQQIDLLTQLVMSSKNIEAKELQIGDNQIGQANDRYSARQSSRQSVKTGRISYV